MPLLDHFRPPLSMNRHWESFHTTWAGSIADQLNERLPEGFFAEEQVHPSSRIEIDVATFEESARSTQVAPLGRSAIAEVEPWAPPAAACSLPITSTDAFEVLVFRSEGGPTLVAAVEMVSPANKDREEHRRAFAVKCASYLLQGVCLAVIDVVTSRRADLRSEILALLGLSRATPDGDLSAVAYRPLRRGEEEFVDLWPHWLTVGDDLPTLPLFLTGESAVPLELEASYLDACRRRRIEP